MSNPNDQSQRILLFAGQLSAADLKELLRDSSGVAIVGVIIHEKRLSPEWHPERTGVRTWTRKELMDVDANVARTPLHDRYEEILAALLSDPRTYYLMERLYGTGRSQSVFNNTINIEKLVWSSIAIFHELQPHRMVSTNTPHDITWFVGRVGEMLGIDFYLTATSPLPWRTWVVKGLDAQNPVTVGDAHGTPPVASDRVAAFVEKGRASYLQAMPEIERKRLEKYRGEFFNPWIETRWILSSRSPRTMARRIYSAFRKKALLQLYDSLSQDFRIPDKYVVFFLHYQPERTTLPDGQQYVQQWLAIRALAEALPPGWHLAVKEHPTTFRHMLDPSVRSSQFYRSMAALPNVSLVPMATASFDLIDRSQAVATIMGTVGVEALLRGKPVLAFGTAQYRGAKGVFAINRASDLQDAMGHLLRGDVTPRDTELMSYFAWVESNSFDRHMRINGSVEALRAAVDDSGKSDV